MIYEIQPTVWLKIAEHLDQVRDTTVSDIEILEFLASEYDLANPKDRHIWEYNVLDEAKLATFILRWT